MTDPNLKAMQVKAEQLLDAIQALSPRQLPPLSDEPLNRFEWMVAAGRLFLPNYRFEWPQMDWWNDSWFTNYLKRVGELDGFNMDRRWNLWQLMRLIGAVDGDTAECGCYRGASSYLMCKRNEQDTSRTRHHHMFDSFEGLSEPVPQDGTHWYKNALTATEQELQITLAGYEERYSVYKGWIPDRFPEVADRKFAFVHIDVDIYEPTRDSVAFFYDRLNPGGILLCDDYAFTSCPGATQAIDEFLADKPEKMIWLADGSGYFIKGTAVPFPVSLR